MSYEVIKSNYKNLRKKISRLWNTHNSVKCIQELYQINKIAYENEVKKLIKNGEEVPWNWDRLN